jgi:hypothetical protein
VGKRQGEEKCVQTRKRRNQQEGENLTMDGWMDKYEAKDEFGLGCVAMVEQRNEGSLEKLEGKKPSKHEEREGCECEMGTGGEQEGRRDGAARASEQ